MTQPQISRRLSGASEWTVPELYDVANVLNVSVHDLMPETPAPLPRARPRKRRLPRKDSNLQPTGYLRPVHAVNRWVIGVA